MLFFLSGSFFIFMFMFNFNFFMKLMFNKMIDLSIEFDLFNFNMMFSMLVILISIKVIFFSKFYFDFLIFKMFKINLMIFIISMIILINSNNIFIILIGWDGLGISSFFLISFYLNNESSISSLITFFFNRLGDSFMLIFSSILIYNFSNIYMMNFKLIMMLILFLGLITKSSQIPFGVWLPMAMSAPTPISSLVHSSTLVTAGIFVMMKMNFIFFIKEIQSISLIFSLLTFFLGGMFALSILDIKKAIAFSTLSQLGLILFSLSMGNFMISFFHLILHAFFKSTLFVNFGFSMKLNYFLQDYRMMNMNSLFFMNKIILIISCLNLMGFISFSGFISKDLILIMYFSYFNKIMIILMMYFSCMLTGAYAMKFIYVCLNLNFKNNKIMNMMKMNFFLKMTIFSLIMILFYSMFLMDLVILDLEIFISKMKKIMFFLIILFSLLLINVLIKTYFLMFKFSSMLFILELLNYMLIKVFFKNNINFIFMLIEFNQIFLIFLILKKLNQNFLMKTIYLVNMIFLAISWSFLILIK